MPLLFRDDIGGRSEKASYVFPDSAADGYRETFPWLRDEATGGPADLCYKCQQLDFAFLFNHSLSETSVENHDDGTTSSLFYGISFGYIGDIRESDTCGFCSLVCTALDQFHPMGRVPDTLDGQQVQCFLSNIIRGQSGLSWASSIDSQGMNLNNIQLSLRTEPVTHAPMSGNDDLFTVQPAAIVRLLSIDEAKYRVVVPRKVGNLVDADLLRQWIQACCASTPAGYSREASFKLRLIDVQQGCITGLATPSRYVALSYVWGSTKQNMLIKSNHPKMATPGIVTSHNLDFPRTIREAIALCKILEEPYLWVDSLCIIQDSDDDKSEQLDLMDLVYQKAVFTLVSAAGNNADAPLPGVSERATKQQLVQIQGLNLCQQLRNFEHSVNPSAWNTRGWTYQERVLSPRKIIFTAEQLFFECEHGECSEDIFVDFHAQEQPPPAERILEDTLYHIPTYQNLNWEVYTSLVETYTHRCLSYSSDILNAFKGISNVIQNSLFDNSPMIHGIPLCALDIGVLWQPGDSCNRRLPLSEFPSWAWAGWIGQITYPALWNMGVRTLSAVEWHLFMEDLSESPRRLQSEYHGTPSSKWKHWQQWQRHVNDSDMIHYTCAGKDPRRWYSHPIDRGITIEQEFISRMSHLGILANTARLTVPGNHANLWSADYRCAEEQHAVCELEILDTNSHRAGIVVLDANTASSLPHGLHTFIKLSQTTLSSGRDDPAWCEKTKAFAGKPGERAINKTRPLEFTEDEEIFDPRVYPIDICWCLYNVMLVETKGDVIYRLGIGQVHIHAFDAAATERKLMRLG